MSTKSTFLYLLEIGVSRSMKILHMNMDILCFPVETDRDHANAVIFSKSSKKRQVWKNVFEK